MVHRKFWKLQRHHRVLFGSLIVVAIIGVWRGLWGLMDNYIFPEKYLLSHLTTLVSGFFILWLTQNTIKSIT
ncbi:MAG: hypothetical protein CL963_02915 [Euryarchaeota archaeon]|mgnify:CR=1 FL=1|jgi:hypothetical protein|nr:hypothetical protein [Euryarchaeota archaeon]HIK01379.1 hypothetical protein [Candidatus Undinarchaeales archaeon ERR594346 U_76725]|tara:strand:- start:9906 stop:10121 length:216 start_codon:yes stop_codon:yes gene_type:complete